MNADYCCVLDWESASVNVRAWDFCRGLFRLATHRSDITDLLQTQILEDNITRFLAFYKARCETYGMPCCVEELLALPSVCLMIALKFTETIWSVPLPNTTTPIRTWNWIRSNFGMALAVSYLEFDKFLECRDTPHISVPIQICSSRALSIDKVAYFTTDEIRAPVYKADLLSSKVTLSICNKEIVDYISINIHFTAICHIVSTVGQNASLVFTVDNLRIQWAPEAFRDQIKESSAFFIQLIDMNYIVATAFPVFIENSTVSQISFALPQGDLTFNEVSLVFSRALFPLEQFDCDLSCPQLFLVNSNEI